ncbi:unnamed protein product [Microthlaspi erraticum]|uniref:Phytocyanin domain-containing protein n=1 Tax=Microthlaspi erraticum TaxID=1685480 RepID=A0A6D2I190_9BRAS|nr:unnamed protein product [Microthlaspi erraticum]
MHGAGVGALAAVLLARVQVVQTRTRVVVQVGAGDGARTEQIQLGVGEAAPAQNHSSGTGSTHKNHHNHRAPSNHSCGCVGSPNNHTSPSNPPNNHTSPSNPPNNHTAPSNHSSGSVGSTHNHTIPSNHYSSGSVGSKHDQTAPISHRRHIEVTVWKSGFHYKKWASMHAPFYVNDVVAFKFNNDQKTNNNKKNDVYLVPDSRSYKICDVSRGRKLVPRKGEALSLKSGGFKFLLRRAQTYYFVSGDHTGCNHNMKFSLFAHKP